MIWKVIFYRFLCLVVSWIFIIINGIIRDSKETREKAEEIKEIYGPKRINTLNIYVFFIIPELIVIGIIIHDIKLILKGEDFID